jgi:hypothetical protein
MVDLRGGLGYHVLICRPVQGKTRSADLKVVAHSGQVVFQLPLVKGSSPCSVLLVSCRLQVDVRAELIWTCSFREQQKRGDTFEAWEAET